MNIYPNLITLYQGQYLSVEEVQELIRLGQHRETEDDCRRFKELWDKGERLWQQNNSAMKKDLDELHKVIMPKE